MLLHALGSWRMFFFFFYKYGRDIALTELIELLFSMDSFFVLWFVITLKVMYC